MGNNEQKEANSKRSRRRKAATPWLHAPGITASGWFEISANPRSAESNPFLHKLCASCHGTTKLQQSQFCCHVLEVSFVERHIFNKRWQKGKKYSRCQTSKAFGAGESLHFSIFKSLKYPPLPNPPNQPSNFSSFETFQKTQPATTQPPFRKKNSASCAAGLVDADPWQVALICSINFWSKISINIITSTSGKARSPICTDLETCKQLGWWWSES